MPIYEFVCEGCQREFEELCSIGTQRVDCPVCKSQETKRKISVFGIVNSSGTEHSQIESSKSTKCGSCRSGKCSSCH